MHIDYSLKKGLASEARVEEALRILKKKPWRYGLKFTIKRFRHAERNSPLDRRHTDFLITLEGGTNVPLQVKSSEWGRKKFERFCRRWNIFIPAIVVHFNEALESIIMQIVEKISLARDFFQRTMNQFIFSEENGKQKRRRRRRQPRFRRFYAVNMCH
jgi:hypothetical protein